MKISILTLFPEMFRGPFDESIIKKAVERNLVTIEFVNIRDFGIGKHKIVDDTPYGGGVGMVMRVDVVKEAIEAAKDKSISDDKRRILLTSAHGRQYNQQFADSLGIYKQLILVCGHYEGIDSRILDYIDEEVSIGDFITTGGEIPSMLITDSVVRRIQGVLKDDATVNESFQKSKTSALEHLQFTKPEEYDGKKVPPVLLSGNHKEIAAWREGSASDQTKQKRPDLLNKS